MKRLKIIHKESIGHYGAPKIHFLLEQGGFSVSLKGVQRILKETGIQSIIIKKIRPAPSAS
ncbi:IS3 family transposase [Bacillus sp. 03113]|uniref:IS3 family transposase n=1 Tax=Bacillus sp. 03113 TaxID=2578211 RepID=UPI0015E887B8|nr:IS3 family transposase [Bacillus sp. 03113]